MGLSRLILRHSAFESKRGAVRATGFLMDMNTLFQEFVTVALRESLGVSERVFLEKNINPLDDGGKIKLRPDLTWWSGRECLFVGDAKYKVADGRIHHDDLYQLLAYMTALELPGGLLIYAQGETDTTTYTVRNSGKRLDVVALDLSGSLDAVLKRVDFIADKIRALHDEVEGLRQVA